MTAKGQIQLLANYIMREIPGEPSRSEGAGDCAVRLLKLYREGFEKIMAELGVPDENYPANVANAYERAGHCFWGEISEEQVSREKSELKSRRDLLKQTCAELETNEDPNAVKEFRAAAVSLTGMIGRLASVLESMQNEVDILNTVADSLAEARPENDLETQC